MPASSAGMTGGNCERERLPRQCQQLLVQALRNLHTFAAGAVARFEAAEAGQPCARLFQDRRQEVFQPGEETALCEGPRNDTDEELAHTLRRPTAGAEGPRTVAQHRSVE